MSDDDLLRQFEDCSLPFDQWVHRAHVRVAYLYLTRHPFEFAVEKMRSGIRAYNAAHHVPDEPNRGYHETMTVSLVAHYSCDDTNLRRGSFIGSFCRWPAAIAGKEKPAAVLLAGADHVASGKTGISRTRSGPAATTKP